MSNLHIVAVAQDDDNSSLGCLHRDRHEDARRLRVYSVHQDDGRLREEDVHVPVAVPRTLRQCALPRVQLKYLAQWNRTLLPAILENTPAGKWTIERLV